MQKDKIRVRTDQDQEFPEYLKRQPDDDLLPEDLETVDYVNEVGKYLKTSENLKSDQ